MQPIVEKCITFSASGWALETGWAFNWKTIELGFQTVTYPGLQQGQLAIVRSVLTHKNGDSRQVHYEQTFGTLPTDTSPAQALDEAIRLNETSGKPSNIVYFVVRGTGNDMAEQVGGYGVAHPAKQAA